MSGMQTHKEPVVAYAAAVIRAIESGYGDWETVIAERLHGIGMLHPGWQPIKTAPRDGTPIIVWADWCSRPFVAWWNPRGRWTISYNKNDASRAYGEPSHWMLLPRPKVRA